LFCFGNEKEGNYKQTAEYLYDSFKELGSQMYLKILFFTFTSFFLTISAP